MNSAVNPKHESYEDAEVESKNKTTNDSPLWPGESYTIGLVTGSAVTDLLFYDPEFQKSWDMLFGCCPWATVFQNRQFVAAWYHVYRQQHLPILVVAMEKGRVTGILPMVLLGGGGKGKITGAGHYDALYQTWLAAPSNESAFIQKALAEIMKKFPGHPISFRFLPPGTPLNWIKANTKWRKRCMLQTYTRPLINFNDPEHEKLYKKKHFKYKMNRLKRLGEVRFETISDPETFESSLNEMAVMYDFRQSALFNKNHFRDDPAKKEFLHELFRLNLLHTTVLNVNGNTMAAIVALTGKDGYIHLAGINCHAPYNSRFYSPGFLHFILLSKQLAEEGARYFDLTPGYDPYKDELANLHDEVHEMVISSELPFRIKRKLKIRLHDRLVAAGIRPMSVELRMKKYFYLLRRRSAKYAIQQLANFVQKKRKQQLYLIRSYTLHTGAKASLHKDNLNDLLQFEAGKGAGITRWEFLADAMNRFDDAQHCFTWIEAGRLLCCAWVSYPDPNSAETNNNPVTENTIVLQGFYCHTAAKNRVPCFLNGMIEATLNKERSSIYLLAKNPVFCRALESAGFPIV